MVTSSTVSLMVEKDCKQLLTMHSRNFHGSVDGQESYLDVGKSEMASLKKYSKAVTFRIREEEVNQEKWVRMLQEVEAICTSVQS